MTLDPTFCELKSMLVCLQMCEFVMDEFTDRSCALAYVNYISKEDDRLQLHEQV
jgi:hypothetical protein